MSNLKYFLPIATELLRKKTNFTQAKDVVHTEIFAISMKIITGIILSFVIIYSLTIIGTQINNILLSMENGQYLSIAAFSSLVVVCSLIIFLVFKSKTTKKNIPTESLSTSELDIDLQKIIITFCEGLAEGFQKTNHEETGTPTSTPPNTTNNNELGAKNDN